MKVIMRHSHKDSKTCCNLRNIHENPSETEKKYICKHQARESIILAALIKTKSNMSKTKSSNTLNFEARLTAVSEKKIQLRKPQH